MSKNIKTERNVIKKKTSIGRGSLSRPLNKNKRRSYKEYRGQGRP